MESFFGFDTTLPLEGDDGDDDMPMDSEDEYNKLNNETFGKADKGDWMDIHENLVRLSENEYDPNSLRKNLYDDHLDFDMNFTKFELEDCEVSHEDVENRVQLDPSIWASPSKSLQPSRHNNIPNMFPNLNNFNNIPQHIAAPGFQSNFAPSPAQMKMVTVEDIERSIINQHHKDLRENQKNKNLAKQSPPKPQLQQHPLNIPPPNIRNQIFPPPPLLNHHSRMPVGYLPYSFLPPHYSGPMNNLAMHPGFNGMPPLAAGLPHPHPIQHPRLSFPMQPNFIQNVQNNQFNKRLVQEIQQNHPMLPPFNRQQTNYINNINNNQQKNHQRSNGMISNSTGDCDEYSNLMTNRERQWLIGIQLTQLNSETPYINDFYYTVWKERLALLKGEQESKAYKDNQLNHPFTQPKGHAQMLLMSSLAKNCGLLNQKNNQRERKNSESKNNNDTKEPGRTYTPLQFENSLGKLQCGSVTAPRKIIDMDVVGSETNLSTEILTQRKSIQILLHIETLYKIVLKMEDLKNPVAIEAALIAKEKKEKERQQSLEQRIIDGVVIEKPAAESCNSSLSTSEADNFDDLLAKLVSGLNQDKVTLMLTVRKGKILLRRILVIIRDHPYRWNLWTTIFSAVPHILKKDRDDSEGILFALYTEFERHIQYSEVNNILELSQVIMSSKKILNYLVSCKFLLSSIITMIFQFEIFYLKSLNSINADDQDRWRLFLEATCNAASKLVDQNIAPQHTIKIDKENNIIKTISNNFAHFKQIECEDFINFITEP